MFLCQELNCVFLLRGERVGVEGNMNQIISEYKFFELAKGRKDWGGETLLLFFI